MDDERQLDELADWILRRHRRAVRNAEAARRRGRRVSIPSVLDVFDATMARMRRNLDPDLLGTHAAMIPKLRARLALRQSELRPAMPASALAARLH